MGKLIGNHTKREILDSEEISTRMIEMLTEMDVEAPPLRMPSRAPRIYTLDPKNDPRWQSFVDHNPSSSIFHTREWLEAIHRTYQNGPVVFTTCAQGDELRNGVPFCEIRSWITGTRFVSLPFSDHCDPLGRTQDDLEELLRALPQALADTGKPYLEIRPVFSNALKAHGFHETSTYVLHELDLSPALEEIFAGLHKSSIQRKIKRSEQLHLEYDEGRSERQLRQFYRLFVQTRRRLRVPPHPIEWFRTLVECLGPKLKIRIALHKGTPIASIITLEHKDVITYKYGCSDAKFHPLGGVPFLFWKTICESKTQGLRRFDLGRSDLDSGGLITFKDRWGTASNILRYWGVGTMPQVSRKSIVGQHIGKKIVGRMPERLVILAGKLLYRHIG